MCHFDTNKADYIRFISVSVTELDVGGETKRFVSGGGRDARRVLAALGIKEINPPAQ